MLIAALLTSWFLYGTFLAPDNTSILRVHPTPFQNEDACNAAKKEAAATMDTYIASGDLKGYVLTCKSVSLDEPKVVEKKETKPEVKK